MKNRNKIFFRLMAIILVLTACKSESGKDEVKVVQEKEKSLIDTVGGKYVEWYPGRKNTKIAGDLDEAKRKDGVWFFYGEDGKELSSTTFVNGLREGETYVRYPDGRMRYKGNYKADKMTGTWTFYDLNGVSRDSVVSK